MKLNRLKSTQRGRYLVRAPDSYPGIRYSGLYCYEHQAIWWLHYNYLPEKGMHIHHVNGDFTDNRIENLEVIHRKEHSKHKHNGGKQPKQFIELTCAYCRSKFIQRESSVNYRKSLGQAEFYCQKKCQVIASNIGRKGIKLNYPKNRKSCKTK